MAFRREQGYPPVRRLARLVYYHTKRAKAQAEATRMADLLCAEIARLELADTDLIGPAPCFFSLQRGDIPLADHRAQPRSGGAAAARAGAAGLAAGHRPGRSVVGVRRRATMSKGREVEFEIECTDFPCAALSPYAHLRLGIQERDEVRAGRSLHAVPG